LWSGNGESGIRWEDILKRPFIAKKVFKIRENEFIYFLVFEERIHPARVREILRMGIDHGLIARIKDNEEDFLLLLSNEKISELKEHFLGLLDDATIAEIIIYLDDVNRDSRT